MILTVVNYIMKMVKLFVIKGDIHQGKRVVMEHLIGRMVKKNMKDPGNLGDGMEKGFGIGKMEKYITKVIL